MVCLQHVYTVQVPCCVYCTSAVLCILYKCRVVYTVRVCYIMYKLSVVYTVQVPCCVYCTSVVLYILYKDIVVHAVQAQCSGYCTSVVYYCYCFALFTLYLSYTVYLLGKINFILQNLFQMLLLLCSGLQTCSYSFTYHYRSGMICNDL